MSKSKNNVVEPGDIIKKFGADTARTFVMFAGPPDQSAAWSNSGAEGTYRFLRRLWAWAYAHQKVLAPSADAIDYSKASHEVKAFRREIYLNLKQAENDFDRMQYNTVVSATMKMMNLIDGFEAADELGKAALSECFGILIRTLYPLAPHITTVLWKELGYAAAFGVELLDAPWLTIDEKALVADEVKLVVQVNGKLRGEIHVAVDASKEAIEAAALANPDVARFVGSLKVLKTILVPGKLVNIVAK